MVHLNGDSSSHRIYFFPTTFFALYPSCLEHPAANMIGNIVFESSDVAILLPAQPSFDIRSIKNRTVANMATCFSL